MSEYLRGNEEQKYGGFQQEEEDDHEEEEEGSIRDYQNSASEEEEEGGHGLDMMVVGKAIKIQESQPRSSLIQAKDTLRHQDGISSEEGSELDLY